MWGLSDSLDRTATLSMGVSLILAVTLWWMLAGGSPVATPADNTKAAPSIGTPEDLVAALQRAEPPPLQSLSAMDERPLFAQSRRPGAAGSSGGAQAQNDSIGNYTLQGIVIGETQRLALLVDPSNQQTIRLAEGEELGRWTAKEIGEDYVVFVGGGTERIVNLAKPGDERDG